MALSLQALDLPNKRYSDRNKRYVQHPNGGGGVKNWRRRLWMVPIQTWYFRPMRQF